MDQLSIFEKTMTRTTPLPPQETRVHDWSQHNQVLPQQQDDTSDTDCQAQTTLHYYYGKYVITTQKTRRGRAVITGVEKRSHVAAARDNNRNDDDDDDDDDDSLPPPPPPLPHSCGVTMSWYTVDPSHTGNCCLLPPRRPWFNIVTLSFSSSQQQEQLQHGLVRALLSHPVGISYSYQLRGGDNIAFCQDYELVDLSARTARGVARQLLERLLLLVANHDKTTTTTSNSSSSNLYNPNKAVVVKIDLSKVDRWCKRNPHFDTRCINRHVYCYFWLFAFNNNNGNHHDNDPDDSTSCALVDDFVDQAQRHAQWDAFFMLFPLYGIARSLRRLLLLLVHFIRRLSSGTARAFARTFAMHGSSCSRVVAAVVVQGFASS